jgi:esterase/lipase superfamily enzyme
MPLSHQGLLLFIRRFDVRFADPARGAAQMAHGLGFDRATMLLSRPLPDQRVSDALDKQDIINAESHLAQFLEDVLKQSEAEDI